MRIILLLTFPMIAAANWAPEWDQLASYDRAKTYLVTVDIQQVTRSIYWTNPATSNAHILIQTNVACARPDATSALLGQWIWSHITNETVTITWSNTAITVTSALVRYESIAITSTPLTASVADRLLLDVYEALYERAVASRHPFTQAEKPRRDLLPDWIKPALFGNASLLRLGPDGRESHVFRNYLEVAKILTRELGGAFIRESAFPSAYTSYPFAENRFLNLSHVLANIGAPTNYFDFTPERDWEGRWQTYGRVITGRWVMAVPLTYDLFSGGVVPATTNEVFTNVVVDACGNSHQIVGTNGQVVTFVCTNDHVAGGFTLANYGLKYLKPLLQAMRYTETETAFYSDRAQIRRRSFSESETPGPIHGDCSGAIDYGTSRWSAVFASSEQIISRNGVLTDAPYHHGAFESSICCHPHPESNFWYSVSVHYERYEREELRYAAGGYGSGAMEFIPKLYLVQHYVQMTNELGGVGYDCGFPVFGSEHGATQIIEGEAIWTNAIHFPNWPNDLNVTNQDVVLAEISLLDTPSYCDPTENDFGNFPSFPWGLCVYFQASSGVSYPEPLFVIDWHGTAGFRFR
ncbi:MAG: hypothetical protein NZM29_08815 [Nitrospira sp.]|nr:hypothetical protein [Nitrospira sp.]